MMNLHDFSADEMIKNVIQDIIKMIQPLVVSK